MAINKVGVMGRLHTGVISKQNDTDDGLPVYLGRLYLNNMSPFLLKNVTIRNMAVAMEEFMQLSMDEIQMSAKSNNVLTRVDNRLFD